MVFNTDGLQLLNLDDLDQNSSDEQRLPADFVTKFDLYVYEVFGCEESKWMVMIKCLNSNARDYMKEKPRGCISRDGKNFFKSTISMKVMSAILVCSTTNHYWLLIRLKKNMNSMVVGFGVFCVGFV